MRLSLLTSTGVHMFLDDVLMLIVLVTGFVALLALGGAVIEIYNWLRGRK